MSIRDRSTWIGLSILTVVILLVLALTSCSSHQEYGRLEKVESDAIKVSGKWFNTSFHRPAEAYRVYEIPIGSCIRFDTGGINLNADRVDSITLVQDLKDQEQFCNTTIRTIEEGRKELEK